MAETNIVKLGIEFNKDDVQNITKKLDDLEKENRKIKIGISEGDDSAIKKSFESISNINKELAKMGVETSKLTSMRKTSLKYQEQLNKATLDFESALKRANNANSDLLKNVAKNSANNFDNLSKNINNADIEDVDIDKLAKEQIELIKKETSDLNKEIVKTESQLKKNNSQYQKTIEWLEIYKIKNEELLKDQNYSDVTKDLEKSIVDYGTDVENKNLEEQEILLKKIKEEKERLNSLTNSRYKKEHETEVKLQEQYEKMKLMAKESLLLQQDVYGKSSEVNVDEAQDLSDIKRIQEEISRDSKAWNSEVEEIDKKYASIKANANSIASNNQDYMSTKNGSEQYNSFLSEEEKYLSNTTKNIKEKKDALSVLEHSYANLESSSKSFNNAQTDLDKVIGQNIDRLKQYVIGIYAMDLAMKTFGRIVDDITELDSRLVEVAKVTDLSGNALEDYTKKAYAVGDAVARTGTEVLEAAGAFARSGETLSDTIALAEEAAVMFNVADNMDSMTTASETLISVLKAYSLEAENARYVTDVINEVSNTSATSFDALADAVTRSGAVYAQSNTSLEEFTALFTTSQEIMQNSEKVSTGLNTISMRLRGIQEAGGEAVEPIAKLQEDFQNIAGVSILDQNNELKSTYDIITDLEGVWDTMTSTQQQYIAELAAGKRQASIFLSLMENGEKIDEVYQNAMNSAGSASEEQERYLDSIEGKMHNLDSAIQNLSRNTVDSGMAKFFLELATNVVKVVDKVSILSIGMGVMMSHLTSKTGLSGLTLLSQGYQKVATKVVALTGQLKLVERENGEISLSLRGQNIQLDEQVKEYAKLIALSKKQSLTEEQSVQMNAKKNAILSSGNKEAIKQMGQVEATAKSSMALFAGLKSFGLGLVAGFALDFLMQQMNNLSGLLADMSDPVGKVTEELSEQKALYEDITSQIEELESKDTRTATEERILGLLKEQQEIRDKEVKNKQAELEDTILNDGTGFLGSGKSVGDKATDATDRLKELEEIEKLSEKEYVIKYKTEFEFAGNEQQAREALENQLGIYGEDIISDTALDAARYFEKEAEQAGDVIQEFYDAVENGGLDFSNIDGKLLDIYESAIDAQFNYNNATDEVVSSTEEASNAIADLGNTNEFLASTLQSVLDEADLLGGALEEMNSAGALSNSTVIEMLSLGGEYANLLELENGQYKMSAESLEYLFQQKKNNAIMELEQKKLTMQALVDYMKTELIAYENGTKLSDAQRETAKNNALATINSVGTYTVAIQQMMGDTGQSAVSSIQAYANSMLQAFDGIGDNAEAEQYRQSISQLESSISGVDKTIEYLNSQTLPSFSGATADAGSSVSDTASAVDTLSESLSNLEDELDRVTEMYEQLQEVIVGKLEDEIDAEKEKLDLLEEEKERYEEMIDVASELLDKEIEALQEQIDLLKEKKDAEDDILALQEAQLNAEKMKQAYLASLGNKNVRVYDDSEGWGYSTNVTDIDGAKEASDSANKELDDLVYEQMVESQEDAINAQIEKLEELQEQYETSLDEINNDIRKHEDVQAFMTEFMNASYEERLEMLGEFQTGYEENVHNEINSTNEKIASLEELKEAWEKALDIEPEILSNAQAQEFLKNFESANYEERKTMLSNFTSSFRAYYDSQITKINELRKAQEASEQTSNSAGGAAGNATSAFNKLNEEISKTNLNADNFVSIFRNAGMNIVFHSNGNASANMAGDTTNRTMYASGGVADFGGHTGIVDWTGAWDDDKWVDGTKSRPEVILNTDQAANVLYKIANQPFVPSVNRSVDRSVNTNNTDNQIIISNLSIQANNGDTLESLINQAQQLARNRV